MIKFILIAVMSSTGSTHTFDSSRVEGVFNSETECMKAAMSDSHYWENDGLFQDFGVTVEDNHGDAITFRTCNEARF